MTQSKKNVSYKKETKPFPSQNEKKMYILINEKKPYPSHNKTKQKPLSSNKGNEAIS